MVTLGSAACADTLPSPSLAVTAWAGAVGLACLSAPQPKSVSVTAPITDNHPADLFMAGPFPVVDNLCTELSRAGRQAW